MNDKAFDEFLRNVISDLRVELTDEFDRNFERKAFFDEPWPETKRKNTRGTLLMRTGALRRSLASEIRGNSIVFSSSRPDASLHNEGGIITVTTKMKKFFWAMYYKASGAVTKTEKRQQTSRSKKNLALTEEAQFWKNMAYLKVGSKITIPKRQFIGYNKQLDEAVQRIADGEAKRLEETIKQSLQRLNNG